MNSANALMVEADSNLATLSVRVRGLRTSRAGLVNSAPSRTAVFKIGVRTFNALVTVFGEAPDVNMSTLNFSIEDHETC
jgi:hypothetical protein